MPELGLFQTDALVEKLAKAFYAHLGYVVRDDYRMQDSTHPTEKACVEMALVAIEEVEFEFAGAEDEDEAEAIKWQRGQSFNENEYYFYKHGNFTLTLLASSQINSTRAEVYLNYLRIHVLEKDVTKEEATAELQEYLGELAGQLQTLSRIEF